MLELIGVDGLTQWDVGRQVKVDKDIDMVHFSNRPYGYSKNVKVTDGVADVPDMFLTSCAPLHIWAYIGNFEKGYTKIEKIYEVKPKNRPEDYIYTPEEIKTWEKLQSEIGDLAGLETEAKENLVAAINEAAKSGGESYTLPQATAEALGGVKADSVEAADTQPVRIGSDGKLYTAAGGTDISLGLTSAAVGQTIKVKAIDESGKPTAWEAADMPSGGGAGLWEHICDITATEEIDGGITISENREGVPLSELQYNEIWVLAKMVGVSTNTNNWWGCTCGIHQKGGNVTYSSSTNGASSGGTTAKRYVSWYTFIRGGKAYWTDGANIDPYDMAGGNQAWLDNFLDQYTFDYFTDVKISSDSTHVIGVDTEIRILGRRA